MADVEWLGRGLKESYHAVELLMNDRQTKAGRRNQVLYALGRANSKAFTASKIQEILHANFPKSTSGVTLGVGQILSEIAAHNRSIIRRTLKGNAFEFTDSRYKMAIRAMLVTDANEKVTRVEL